MKFSKKCLALILMVAVLLLPACGNQGGTDTGSTDSKTADKADPNALDLTGNWDAETKGNDYYLAGFIKGDLIELHWSSAQDKNGSVYWAGTYEAPTEDTDTYSWTSIRDEAIMANSGYAAPDDAREFTYADGKLTLEAGQQGYSVVLIPSDEDYSGMAVKVSDEDRKKANDAKKDKGNKNNKADKESNASTSNKDAAKQEKTKDVQLVDSGYAIEQVGGGVSMVYYGVELANVNKYNAIQSPTIEITVRAKDGSLVSKQKRTLSGIAPDTRIVFGDTIKCKNGKPQEVEITVKNADYDITPYEGSGVFAASDLKVKDVKETHEKDRAIYKGTVVNSTPYEVPGVLVSVVYYKNGKIVGGATTRLKAIAGNDEASFTIQNRSEFDDYDEFEAYAIVEA